MAGNYPSSEFVKEADLPVIGTQCLKCRQGYIVAHQFTSKKGELFTGVKCDSCNYSWIKSNWDDKPVPAGGTGSTALNYKSIGLKLDKLNERLDVLGSYLSKEIEPYVKSIYNAMVDDSEKKATKELNEDLNKEAKEAL
ncbi:MAG: hypothetical protein ACTSQE_06960 [Candidatus Heimdallarchaeaceae archaeon]